MEKNVVEIDPLSAKSLLLEVRVNNNPLSTATGFVVEQGESRFLITNWHVLSSRNAETGKPLSDTAGIPDEVRILHHVKGPLGSKKSISETLFDTQGNRRWLEHSHSRRVDVVALPLCSTNSEIDYYPFDLSQSKVDILPDVGMQVFIIGFPYGLSNERKWPIWKSGNIASEPDLDFDGSPSFLIDATTRIGMSGSPMVLRMPAAIEVKDAALFLPEMLKRNLWGFILDEFMIKQKLDVSGVLKS
jgi:hypothetical protein